MPIRGGVTPVLAITSLLWLAACDTPAAQPPDAPPAAWRLSAEPDYLTAGGLVNGDSVPFFGISDGELTPEGIAVLALGRRQNTVITLDAAGQIRRVLGGAGDGPQELGGTPQLSRFGERIVVLDATRRRYMELQETALGDGTSYQPGARQRLLGLLADGAVLTTPTVRSEDPAALGQEVTPFYLRRGPTVDTLAGPSSPPEPSVLLGTTSGGVRITEGLEGCLPENLYATTDTALLIGQASSGTVLSLSRSGTLDTLYRSPDRGRVTQAMLDGVQGRIDGTIESAQFLPEGGDIRWDTKPVFERVGKLGDPLPSVWTAVLWDGQRLWLRRAVPCFTGAEDVEPSLWDLIDIESRSRVATVEVPASLLLLASSSDRVLAVSRDAFDVEHVGVYRILR